jgi:hypothetical protein
VQHQHRATLGVLSDWERTDAPLRGTLGWISACCLALLLSACAGLDAKRTEKLQSVRTVGIISAFAETFHARKLGLIGKELTKFPIASWALMMPLKPRCAPWWANVTRCGR